jgi:hypothetical protein
MENNSDSKSKSGNPYILAGDVSVASWNYGSKKDMDADVSTSFI